MQNPTPVGKSTTIPAFTSAASSSRSRASAGSIAVSSANGAG